MKNNKLIQIGSLMLLPVLTFAFTQIFYKFGDQKDSKTPAEVAEANDPKTVVEFKARIKERKAQTELIDDNIEDLQLEIRNLKNEKQTAVKTLKREQFIYNAIVSGHLRVSGDSMLESLYPTIEVVARINAEANDNFADVVILGDKVLVHLKIAKLFGTNQKHKIVEGRINRLDKLIRNMATSHDLKKLVMFFPPDINDRLPAKAASDDGDEEEVEEVKENPEDAKFARLEGIIYDRYQTLFEKIDVKTQKSGDPKIVFEVVSQSPTDDL